MSGTMVTTNPFSGTWTATKNATNTSADLQQAASVKKGVNDEGK